MPTFIDSRCVPVHKGHHELPTAPSYLSPEIYRLSCLVSELILLMGFDDPPPCIRSSSLKTTPICAASWSKRLKTPVSRSHPMTMVYRPISGSARNRSR